MKRHPVPKPDRLYALKTLIERQGCVPMKEILDRLEVSRATAKRDIEFLRDRMGVPIEWDAFGGGYRIRAEERSAESAPRELPGLWFTDQEIEALLALHDLVSEADDRHLLVRNIVPLQRRLLLMLGDARREVQQVLGRVRLVVERSAAG